MAWLRWNNGDFPVNLSLWCLCLCVKECVLGSSASVMAWLWGDFPVHPLSPWECLALRWSRGGGSCLGGGVRVHRFNYGERGRGGLTSKRRGCSTLLCNKQESYLNILLLVQTETVLSLLILCVSWLCPQLNYLAEETSEGQGARGGKEGLTDIYHQLFSRKLFIIN